MNTQVQELVAQAAQLPPEDQATLLTALHDLVFPSDPTWETAWVNECQDRLDAYERGAMASVDSDQAMAALREKHGLS